MTIVLFFSELRSNSAGAVYSIFDPSEVFGKTIIVDTSPNKELSDKTYHIKRSTTIPSSRNKGAFIREVSLTAQGSPLPPPTGILSNHTDKRVTHSSSTKKEKHDKDTVKYEFGKAMHDYAKKLDAAKNKQYDGNKVANHKDVVPVSKSDGDIHQKKEIGNHLSNSHSTHHFNKANHHHHQCCSGFGSGGNRHRFQSNACVIN